MLKNVCSLDKIRFCLTIPSSLYFHKNFCIAQFSQEKSIFTVTSAGKKSEEETDHTKTQTTNGENEWASVMKELIVTNSSRWYSVAN